MTLHKKVRVSLRCAHFSGQVSCPVESVSGIGAPPTQIIAKDLTKVWGDWQKFERTVEEKLAKETMSKWTLKSLALLSEHLLYLTTAAVNDAMAAALKELPQIPSNLINVAGC